VATPDLPGVARPHRRRCDETEELGWPKRRVPGPLALLPVVRSPSRPCRHDRWWALTPPVRPLPGLRAGRAGMFSVAVVVRTRLSPACPHLPFRRATLPAPDVTISRDWESGSSSRQHSALPSASQSSDGSPTCYGQIIPRDGEGIKYRTNRCRAGAWALAPTRSARDRCLVPVHCPLDRCAQLRYLGGSDPHAWDRKAISDWGNVGIPGSSWLQHPASCCCSRLAIGTPKDHRGILSTSHSLLLLSRQARRQPRLSRQRRPPQAL
jgi:hypothetical protein